MAIKDLFSHKIHSSGDEWPEKLAELAEIFAEFDGQTFDRDAFEERLQRISPRASYLAAAGTPRAESRRKDVSKFRDEISAYPAYLGLYFLQQSPSGWVVRLSETARRFLVREEPDVASFLRLQLPLFQYPNAMGAAYRTGTNDLRLQVNAGDLERWSSSATASTSPLRGSSPWPSRRTPTSGALAPSKPPSASTKSSASRTRGRSTNTRSRR